MEKKGLVHDIITESTPNTLLAWHMWALRLAQKACSAWKHMAPRKPEPLTVPSHKDFIFFLSCSTPKRNVLMVWVTFNAVF